MKSQPQPILQSHIPEAQLEAAAAGLPKMQPVNGQMLVQDNAYAAQLAEKARLLVDRREDVLRVLPEAEAACEEVLEIALAELAQTPGFSVSGATVTRPDGAKVCLSRGSNPLESVATLIQEDVAILQKHGEEHVLTGGLLCFPASWTLAEKLGRPLIGIHTPVPDYTEGIAKRVQRLFDGLQLGRPLWRANLLRYRDPNLFHPRTEASPREGDHDGAYLRSERQTLVRLPKTGAVAFFIHTSVIEAKVATRDRTPV